MSWLPSFGERRIVDNRVFLLGLDKLYRDAMKRHERDELLTCARRVAAVLHVEPADVPIEGYYTEDDRLTEFFRLMRGLQAVDQSETAKVDSLSEFRRLLAVTSAPLYGQPQQNGKLLPAGRDALAEALAGTFPNWNVPTLTAAAYAAAQDTDDFSLVGLAALVKDAVVLTATRESVVLYAAIVIGSALHPPRPKYSWTVDAHLAQQAKRFIDTFNALFGEKLPAAIPSSVEHYWHACDNNEILGRCVRIGSDRSVPPRHYHWAIGGRSTATLEVDDFWDGEVWTTARYRRR